MLNNIGIRTLSEAVDFQTRTRLGLNRVIAYQTRNRNYHKSNFPEWFETTETEAIIYTIFRVNFQKQSAIALKQRNASVLYVCVILSGWLKHLPTSISLLTYMYRNPFYRFI